MAGVGAALLFIGAYMMYQAYKGVHTKTAATPLTTAKAALAGG